MTAREAAAARLVLWLWKKKTGHLAGQVKHGQVGPMDR